MITAHEALEKIFGQVTHLPMQTVPLSEAVGRVLAQDMYANDDLPPFDNSAMDGYAVLACDLTGASPEKPVILRMRNTLRAGSLFQEKIHPGEAIKIMTGAAIPGGADTIVIKEKTEPQGDEYVRIFHSPQVGKHIRRSGEDIRSGDLFLKEGTMIRAYEVALLASQGMVEIPAVGKPKVSIIVTGDELVNPCEPVSFGKIRNANGPGIAGALTKWGAEVIDMGIVRDNQYEIKNALTASLAQADMIIVSGGVSVGDYDYTRTLLKGLGVREIFWKVAIKPGKPLFFGIYPSVSRNGRVEKPVFGLPGNPVSALVCLEEFVRPSLEQLQGYAPKYPGYHLTGRVINDFPVPPDRQQFIFCQATQDDTGFKIRIIRPQGAAMMGMACQANALALSPVGARRVTQGDILPFRWLK